MWEERYTLQYAKGTGQWVFIKSCGVWSVRGTLPHQSQPTLPIISCLCLSLTLAVLTSTMTLPTMDLPVSCHISSDWYQPPLIESTITGK